ncbi:MAG: trypsin-like peptidase domain-containing protein, partial [Acidimicrobiales bacterium]|nr:trypsin-like peptidase domain-containing protein [Acidimicrobiales bacterium]
MSNPWSPDPVPPLDPGAAPSAPPYAYQPAPPYGAPPVGPGVPPAAGQPQLPPPSNRAKAGRRGPWFFVLGLFAVLGLIAAGFGLGKVVSDDGGDTAASSSPVPTSDVSQSRPADPAPIEGTGTEPIADVAAAVAPTVVQIETDTGLGSGFVYDEEGLILTAAHVVGGSTGVNVRLADGTLLEGEVLGADDGTDVAVIKVDPSQADLQVAALATGVPIQVGQTAVAVGSPFGLDQTVTAGIVSAVDRSFPTSAGVLNVIQPDAPINSGNSGGALADRQGRIIGINDAILTDGQSTGNVGVGFAIPIDIAKAVADKIVAGQPTSAGFLGVEGADATGTRAGAAITSV